MSFTYSGPSVAAAFTASVLSEASARALSAGTDAASEFGAAAAVVAATPESFASTLTTTPPVPVPVIDIGELLDRQAALGALTDQTSGMVGDLVADMDGFLGTYFPAVATGVATARTALQALMDGSNFADGREVSRLNMERTRERIDRDRDEKDAALIADFAARGFPAPPGELLHQLAQRQRAEMLAIADAKHDDEQQQAARERDALERTVTLLVDMRAQALKTFAGYLASACVARFERTASRAQAAAREFNMLAQRLAQLQSATNRAAALEIRAAGADHQLAHGYLAGLDKLAEQQAGGQLEAALAVAKMLGQQAAAAYNMMRGAVDVSGSEEMNEI